jgi:RNA polymerase sigma-70 factor (ECF subfamily)
MENAFDVPTSWTLLRGMSDLDNESWRRFLERYRPMIEAWCRRKSLAPSDVEEVTSVVLAKLARAMPTFVYDPQRGFRAWLKTTVQHAVADFWRTRGRRPWDQGSGDSNIRLLLEQQEGPDHFEDLVQQLDADLEAERKLLHAAMAAARQRVQPHTWNAFRLRVLENRPGKEVAEQLGISVASVHVARRNVFKMIQQEVARLQRPGAALP